MDDSPMRMNSNLKTSEVCISLLFHLWVKKVSERLFFNYQNWFSFIHMEEEMNQIGEKSFPITYQLAWWVPTGSTWSRTHGWPSSWVRLGSLLAGGMYCSPSSKCQCTAPTGRGSWVESSSRLGLPRTKQTVGELEAQGKGKSGGLVGSG